MAESFRGRRIPFEGNDTPSHARFWTCFDDVSWLMSLAHKPAYSPLNQSQSQTHHTVRIDIGTADVVKNEKTEQLAFGHVPSSHDRVSIYAFEL